MQSMEDTEPESAETISFMIHVNSSVSGAENSKVFLLKQKYYFKKFQIMMQA